MPAPTILRFPGSKAQFIRQLSPWLDALLRGRKSFHDVFCGGGTVALMIAERFPRLELHLNDLDPDLSAFWRVVAGNEVEGLCDRLDIRPTLDLFTHLRRTAPTDEIDRAFRALFFSRCSFSGLLDGSPLGGFRQMSPNRVFSRYHGLRLIEQVMQAHRLLAGRTVVSCMDGAQYVRRHPKAPMYLDPPYFEKGDSLYRQRMTLADHLVLADALRTAPNWVLSYDRSPVVEAVYEWADRRVVGARYSINGRKAKWAAKEELVIMPPGKR
jgi:DNA adenine methylase